MERGDSTRWTLVRAAADGDASSRDEFSKLYGPVLRSYFAARWRLSPLDPDVADGVQEVFLQCFKPGGALTRADASRAGGFRAYLYGIARNVASTLDDARRRRAPSRDDLDVVAADDASLSRVFDRAYAKTLTRAARDLMRRRAGAEGSPSALRVRALELMYEHGLKAGDVADRMGIEASAVYIHLSRARKEFHAALLEVLAADHPDDGKEDLERRCREVFSAL
jgi:RNA polymerase sigma factor (sigma-70 family)